MSTIEGIKNALEILELSDRASLKQIDDNFKKLIKRWHPDKCRKKSKICHEKTRQLIESHELLVEYCKNYIISFTDEEINKELSAEELWEKQFGDDSLWGGTDKK